MIERNRSLTVLTHVVLLLGIAFVMLPVWLAIIASTHHGSAMMTGPVPLLPGDQTLANYSKVLFEGSRHSPPVFNMMLTSLLMATAIATGKISISILSAFAIVYFRTKLRIVAFWLIFVTLMLPVEVRIVPTFQVVADMNLLNSYYGLTLPLMASATATFLFRQFFRTIPVEMVEAAKIDGAGPLRFFRDHLLPLSRTNIAALFLIFFTFGWNQYLWPLLITTEPQYYTVVMGIQRMLVSGDIGPAWNTIMATATLAMMPPVLLFVMMQRLFIKGLVEVEK